MWLTDKTCVHIPRPSVDALSSDAKPKIEQVHKSESRYYTTRPGVTVQNGTAELERQKNAGKANPLCAAQLDQIQF